MSTKSAEERFGIACNAIKTLQRLSELMSEAAVYNSNVQKNLTELSSMLSTAIQILDPDKSDEFVKQVNADYMRKQMQERGIPEDDGAMTGGYL